MSYILGLTGPSSYDQAAVLLKDGRIVAAVEEERFTGIKHHRYGPPINAITYCLEKEGISAKDVEHVAIGWGSKNYWTKGLVDLFIRRPFMALNMPTYVNDFKRYNYELMEGFDSKLVYVPHHLSHMASTFYCSGYKKANIIVIDESGETMSTSLGFGAGEDIEVFREYSQLNSLGRLYRQFTEYLGFIGNSDEYKVMALAAYGKPINDAKDLIKYGSEGYSLETGHFYKSLIASMSSGLGGFLSPNTKKMELKHYLNYGNPRAPNQRITKKHADIAATIQKIYETALEKLAEILFETSGHKKICLAGGCALNCVANGKILNRDFVDDLFVQPASSDAGSALGAALFLAVQEGHRIRRLEDVSLGPQYGEQEILDCLKSTRVKYHRASCVEAETADMLSKNKVVGWFQGGMEFGPRALGNRSILANPCIGKNSIRVNRLKERETWRPFAPSILAVDFRRYFCLNKPNPFMTVTQKVREDMVEGIPAVVHVDGTTRYQTVTNHKRRYHDLIGEFKKRSGIPVILNTSFNSRGQPIVRTPYEAVKTSRKMGLDALVIGDFIIH